MTSAKKLVFSAARALLAMAAVVGAAPSHAVIYSGHWDPTFGGSTFSHLGWTASSTFGVPAPCLAQPDNTYDTSSSACSGMTFLSATVDFYDARDLTKSTLESFLVGNGAGVTPIVTLAHNEVTRVASNGFFDQFNPSAGGAASGVDGGGSYYFLLAFDPAGVAGLRACPNGSEGKSYCQDSAPSALGVIQAVPEPNSVALVLAGLVGVGAVARRRQRKSLPAVR